MRSLSPEKHHYRIQFEIEEVQKTPEATPEEMEWEEHENVMSRSLLERAGLSMPKQVEFDSATLSGRLIFLSIQTKRPADMKIAGLFLSNHRLRLWKDPFVNLRTCFRIRFQRFRYSFQESK